MKLKLTEDRRKTFQYEKWRIKTEDERTRIEVIRRLSEFGPPQMETPFYYNGKCLLGFLTTFQIAEDLVIDKALCGYNFIAFHKVSGRPSWSVWEEGRGAGNYLITQHANPSHWKNKFSMSRSLSKKR